MLFISLIFRIQKIRFIIRDVEECFLIREKINAYLDLIKLITSILMISHICACAWHYIAISSKNMGYNQCWLDFFDYKSS